MPWFDLLFPLPLPVRLFASLQWPYNSFAILCGDEDVLFAAPDTVLNLEYVSISLHRATVGLIRTGQSLKPASSP